MTQLKKAIRLRHATAMVAGTIIGASIFVQPSEISQQIPTIWGVLVIWLICGILTLFGSLVCAELASIFTKTGGVYVYLKEAFSPAVGFLWGWAMFWSIHSGIIAAIAVIFARYTAFFYPLDNLGIQLVAVGLILLHTLINLIGVKEASNLQTWVTLGKILAIGIIIIIGFSLGSAIPEHFRTGNSIQNEVTSGHLTSAIIAGLFAFGGWHMVTYNSEETINPKKTIPQALILGTLIVTVCYVAMNAVYLYILPLSEVASSQRIAADAANALLGRGGGGFMAALVMFSTFGSIAGIILAGPRVYYSMAQDGVVFKWIGDLHPKFGTPYKAIILQAIWSCVLVLTGTYRSLFTRVIYTEWIFFGLLAVALFIFRKKKYIHRQYNIWGYPVVPIIFILSSFFIVINQIIHDPGESFIGLSVVLAGLVVYYVIKFR